MFSIAITYLILISALLIYFMAVVKDRFFINPLIILHLIPFFLYLIEPILAFHFNYRNEFDNETLVMLLLLIWIISIGVGYNLSRPLIRINNTIFSKTYIRIFFTMMLILNVLYVVRINGEIPSNLYQLRLYYIKTGQSNIAFINTILSLFFAMILMISVAQREKLIFIILFSLPLLASGTKGAFYTVLIFSLAAYQLREKLKIKYLVSIFLTAVFSMFYLLMSLHNINGFKYSIWHYADHFRNLNILIDRLYNHGNFYYGEILFGKLIYLIPRIIWEEKPRIYGIHILAKDINPKKFDDGIFTAFGPVGNMIADFGLVFFIFYIIFMNYLIGILFKSSMKYQNVTLLLLAIYFNLVGLICFFVIFGGNYIFNMFRNSLCQKS